MSATVNGAAMFPGCTNSPGAALRTVTRPLIGLDTTRIESIVLAATIFSMSAEVLPKMRTASTAAL